MPVFLRSNACQKLSAVGTHGETHTLTDGQDRPFLQGISCCFQVHICKLLYPPMNINNYISNSNEIKTFQNYSAGFKKWIEWDSNNVNPGLINHSFLIRGVLLQ